ncbi:MAG: HNH endonuclease family protein [Prevotella sp.]|jgi:hypothetical protein
MDIKLADITIRDLVADYEDNGEGGVFGFHKKLNIRPPYQREFIYNDKQREAVIDTVFKGFPLNTMYWAVNENGTFEIIDGQQRTISICQFVNGDFSYQGRYFHNLEDDEQSKILDYKLSIYQCSGTNSEKLDWFKTINIAGEELTQQELRNAVYSGSWVSDAKRFFSKTGCPAYKIGKNYINGSPIRQDYLQTAILWAAYSNKGCMEKKEPINEYMAVHQHDDNATILWGIYQKIINWIKTVFPKYNKYQKGIDWGKLYWQFKDENFDTKKLQNEVDRLMMDDDVTNKKGIFIYVLTGKESSLSIRSFTDAQKMAAYIRQKGICPICGKHFEIEDMEGDHITPWSEGGHTTTDNLQMLCKDCNRHKSNK